eukprot:gb/GEZN01011144.1/.p1 GENE.gb/GEZN01011144.1/~~gb/GEZN01011144.1/.p1  ORF type:complete len:257 (-),score=33.34 gb/GEZN01011144.1/:411-1085(-)
MADELKTKARRLETSLNAKLAQFAALPDQLRRKATSSEGKKDDSSGDNPAVVAQTLAKELEEMLIQLSGIIDRMEASPDSSALQFMIQRYHSIAKEARAELYRTQTTLTQELQRQALFGDAAQSSSSLRPRTETLLREKKQVEDCVRATDEAIAIAIETKNSLGSQGTTFVSIKDRVASIQSAFPRVGHLIAGITRHKNRDMLVMALVMSLCFFFTIVYVWTVK